MKMKVICCGNVAFDLIAKTESKKGGIIFDARPGGSVLNTAILLSRLGLPVSMIAKTGKDFLGDSLLKTMRREKLETKYCIQEKSFKTGLAIAKLDKKGDSSYVFFRTAGPQTSFRGKNLPCSLFKKTAVFHTASAYSYADHTFSDTLEFMKRAKKENVLISYDPNWRKDRIADKKTARLRIRKLIRYVDLLKLSETDALGITGAKTLTAALRSLPENIVVTVGKKGSFFWDGKKKVSHPAFKIPVTDTIGAGDGFTAGLIYRYCLKGKEIFWKEKRENLAFASAVSALVCRGRGATESLKGLSQVRKFL